MPSRATPGAASTRLTRRFSMLLDSSASEPLRSTIAVFGPAGAAQRALDAVASISDEASTNTTSAMPKRGGERGRAADREAADVVADRDHPAYPPRARR